jgi:hypothetical protein
MRFLKRKLALALEKDEKSEDLSPQRNPGSKANTKTIQKQADKRSKKALKAKEYEKKLATKNIIKNYSRAIGNFAMSDLFLPYVSDDPLCATIDWKEFVAFSKDARDTIQNIDNLKERLIINENDEPKIVTFKRLFKMAAEIFIKYFSVNWIFSAKLIYKQCYVQYRGTLLRGIQNPSKLTICPQTSDYE